MAVALRRKLNKKIKIQAVIKTTAAFKGKASVKSYLNKTGSCGNLPIKMFLSLLLLNFEGESGSQDSLKINPCV
jgi:hypothetical protein